MNESILPSVRELLAEFVALPGPPGQEDAVRDAVARYVTRLGLPYRSDARGNLIVGLGENVPERARVVVTAHLDEIALMVTGIDGDDSLTVSALGGVYPWKWGEGPVTILAGSGSATQHLPGILSFGSIHTTSPRSAAQQAREGRALTWEAARIVTGLSAAELARFGVRPGTRVVLSPARRTITELGGGLLSSFFFDDRADIVSWLLALERLRNTPHFSDVVFAVTAAEEVGGHGALYLLRDLRPEICIALEIGPTTPDAPFPLDADPTVWVSDSFATTSPADLDFIALAAKEAHVSPHFHAVTRGGSDATCAAANGLCARPITLAFAAENSHGCEIMHRDAPERLTDLLVALLCLMNTPPTPS
jgi:putative aminopeptidase FrvX